MYRSTMSALALLWLLSFPLVVGCIEQPEDQTIHYPNANVELPPDTGDPFFAGTLIDLQDFGYEQQEFFLRGEAYSYENTAALGSDGQWQVAPVASELYRTRMLVYRPRDAADFNGTVLVEWLNVTGGLDTGPDWIMLNTELMRRGYVWVGVSAQYVGVEGGDAALPMLGGLTLALKTISPFRYQWLSHPGDSYSYDIFAQAVRAIRDPQGIAPMGDLAVQHLLAAGESQSAARLLTYVNAFGPDDNFIDGYFIHSRMGYIPDFGGASAPLSQSPQAVINTPEVVKVREDLTAPVMNLQTETDVIPLGAYASRQPDSDRFRLWEVAGTAHADVYTIIGGMLDKGEDERAAEIVISNAPMPLIPACPQPVNSAPQHHFVAKAALHALNRWVAEGVAPAMASRLTTNSTNDGFEFDAYGNALGGVRSPYVDVPTAIMSGINDSMQNDTDICFLFGTTALLDDVSLQSLYSDHAAYLAAVTAAAQQAVSNGFLLAEDAELIISAAQAADIPPQ